MKLITENDQYCLKSNQFTGLSDPDSVRQKAEEIVTLLNGSSKIVLGSRNSFSLGVIMKLNEDGTRQGFVNISEELKMKTALNVKKISADGSIEEVNQADPIQSYMDIALKDKNVAKVFRLLSNYEYDWSNLYKIFEIIEDDISGKSEIAKRQWVTEKVINRFTHTANSVGAIGDEARHGKERTQPPKDPMSAQEAKAFIEILIHNWLRLKNSKPTK